MEPDPLLSEIEDFLATTGVNQTEFGRAAMGDAKLVPELRRGRELRRSTARRVREQMDHYRRHGKFGGAKNGQDTQGEERA